MLLLTILWAGCKKDQVEPVEMDEPYVVSLPNHFQPVPVPHDNPLTKFKVELGKQLFFDPILSRDSSISCGSCHFPSKAFADPRQFSLGVDDREGTRNAPALINLAYGRSFFRDGSSPTLERQILFPIESEVEMHNTMPVIMDRLKQHPAYVEKFERVFGGPPTVDALTDAIASYERILLSYNAPYDRYLSGDSTALTASQKRGMALFFGERAECFHCHGGFNFTDEAFHNNGLYPFYEDKGRWNVTGKDSDLGKFKTPTLRNIAHTAPYMHDGSLNTLEEVVDHYMSGGAFHLNKSVLVRQFFLNDQERADLVQFLHALSDQDFLENPDFRR